jgi:hypothetical protein
MVHLRSSHGSVRDVSPNAFSSTLTTLALNQNSLRSFKASPCQATLEGLPPSLHELRISFLLERLWCSWHTFRRKFPFEAISGMISLYDQR